MQSLSTSIECVMAVVSKKQFLFVRAPLFIGFSSLAKKRECPKSILKLAENSFHSLTNLKFCHLGIELKFKAVATPFQFKIMVRKSKTG